MGLHTKTTIRPGGVTFMRKFIIGTFLILGFGFYELSDGPNFTPEVRPIVQTAVSTKSLEVIPFDAPVVTRSATEMVQLAPIEDAEVITASRGVTPTVAEIPESIVDLREVAGKRVNMRSGPGTDYGVLDTLARGMQTEVIEVNADGWARVRVITTDQVGWMAARLLTDG
ncbi:MAG: hypothetical protein ACI9TA_000690 [Reinekea sp.]|jgi:hypothetical protein